MSGEIDLASLGGIQALVEGAGLEIRQANSATISRTRLIHDGSANKLSIDAGVNLDWSTISLSGNDNSISIGEGSALNGVTIEISSHRDYGNFDAEHNSVIIGSGCHIDKLNIRITGSNNRIVIGPHVYVVAGQWNSDIVADGFGCDGSIGEGTSVNGSLLMEARELRSTIEIGRDNMLARFVRILSSDSHPIYESGTLKRINGSGNIRTGNSVWIGIGATLLRNAGIGSDSIIGANSLLTKPLKDPKTGEILSGVTVMGTPAKVTEHGTKLRWSRKIFWNGDDEQLQQYPDARAISAFARGEIYFRDAMKSVEKARDTSTHEDIEGARRARFG